MITPTDFSISPSSGESGVTNFELDSGIVDTSYKVTWYFGDGSTFSGLKASHTYTSPGKYIISSIIYHGSDAPVFLQKEVEISLNLNNSICFSFIPPPTFAGHYNRYPFRVNITSPDVQDHYVNLGCQFSRSDSPQDIPNKWSFLRPQWRFFDVKGNPVQKIKTIDTLIKANSAGNIDPLGTNVIGVSGYADFYFTDDIYNFDLATSNQPYTTIIATLDTLDSKDFTLQSDSQNLLPSFANSLASVTCPHVFLWRTPDYLKISENGIRKHSNPRWTSSNVPIIVNPNFNTEVYDPFKEGNGVKVINPDSFFVHNFPIDNRDSLYLNLQSPNHNVAFSPEPSLEWTDSSYYKTPGYYKGVYNLQEVSATNLQINAALTFNIPPLSGNYYSPLLWLSTPCKNQLYISEHQKFPELSNISSNDPVYTRSVFLSSTPASNNYTIAANLLPDYHAWVLDEKFKKIHRVSSFGQILTSIDIPKLLENSLIISLSGLAENYLTPSFLITDRDKNLWVSLKNGISSFKLDSFGNFLTATNPFIFGGYREYTKPVNVETDTQSNLYVSYTNSSEVSGFVVKYFPDGTICETRNFLEPVAKCNHIKCDNSNHVWFVHSLDPVNNFDIIEKKSAEGNLVYYTAASATSAAQFGPYNNVNHLTVDRHQNLWFTCNNKSLYKISSITYEISSIELISELSPIVPENRYAITGLASNFGGKIYAINADENLVYVVNDSMVIEDTFHIKASSCAVGDWTGFNWINKYGASIPEFSVEETYKTIYGNSEPLDFYVDTATNYNFLKVNENYDLAKTLKSYAFTPKLNESPELFDKFFGSVYGQYPFKPNDPGVETYQKIANFVSNHNDIDTCNIDQLYSNSEMVDLLTDDFRLKYPASIQRLMDLASINQSRLRGSTDSAGLEFNARNQSGFFNRGTLISSFSYRVSGGIPLVLGNKTTYNPYKLIYTGRIGGKRYYDIDVLADYLGLPYPWRNEYEFYTYVPSTEGDQLEGIIDWNNPQTTISFSNSSSNVWSGHEGILETVFGYELYKGLNLLND